MSLVDWFNLDVEIDEAISQCEFDSDGCREDLVLTCRGSELSRLLIGKNHIFNSRGTSATEGRTECRFRICVRRRSLLGEDAVEGIGVGNDAVGELKFWKEYEFLDAYIFIEDVMFERCSAVFLLTRHKISATIGIALDQSFSGRQTVGDESQITWNIDEDCATSKAKIRSWSFELANRLWKDSASKSQYK